MMAEINSLGELKDKFEKQRHNPGGPVVQQYKRKTEENYQRNYIRYFSRTEGRGKC